MARIIVWSKKAEVIFKETLEFYYFRNGNKNYSRKLAKEVKEVLKSIANYPFIGIKVENENIRVFILKHYKIFYEIKSDAIIVILIKDTRTNPDNLKI